MRPAASRTNILVAAIVAATACGLAPRRADAQCGFGTGFGFDGFLLGFGGFSQVPKPESYLYQQARLMPVTSVSPHVTSTPTLPIPTSTTFVTPGLSSATLLLADMVRPAPAMGTPDPLRPRPARRSRLLRRSRSCPFPAFTTNRTSSSGPARHRRPESSKRSGRSSNGQARWF